MQILVPIGGLWVRQSNLGVSLAVYPVILFLPCGMKFATLNSPNQGYLQCSAFPVLILIQKFFIPVLPNQPLPCAALLTKTQQIYNAILIAFLVTLVINTYAGRHAPLQLHMFVENPCAQIQLPLAHR